ncbi:MAG: hypothetical protein ABI422_04380 [Sphingomicrobium sp.]
MASEAAGAGPTPLLPAMRQRLRLPERVPDLRRPWLTLFELLWFPALLLAIAGPLAGTWYRLASPDENSALMIGSRAGLCLSEDDLTRVRFPVGDAARAAGVRPGDDIVAINGVPIAHVVPISARGIARPNDATDLDYAAFSPIIEGTDPVDLDLRLRGEDGRIRDYRVRTGEQHIEQDARRVGLSPTMLSVIDLLHVITYPFLLFAAWVLHRRKREDLISSILSLAILLTMATEQPSAAFLQFVLKMPEWFHQRLYDVGNIALLAGILLFPYGRLRPRAVLGFIALLPLLFFLKGDTYRLTFMLFMAACVMTLVWRLRHTEAGDAHQQIKWALFGFAGYALFLSLALAIDMGKLNVGAFGTQILMEVLGGLSFGLAFLFLQLGLLIALLRFRLYDAEAVISRSASFAMITLALGAVFAATSDGLKQIILNYTGQSSGTGPVVFAAAIATVLINPVQSRIQSWSENWFQRDLVKLRTDLPECARDMRETASLSELLEDVLARIEAGVRTIRLAALIDGKVLIARGVSVEDVEAWSAGTALECTDGICEIADRTFPLRVPLTPAHGDTRTLGYILIGPRPDGSVLSKEEQRTLVEVAEPVSRAIRNVIKREQREHTIAAHIAASDRRIAKLEAKLARPLGKPKPRSP